VTVTVLRGMKKDITRRRGDAKKKGIMKREK
jgi:hypothetical protein